LADFERSLAELAPEEAPPEWANSQGVTPKGTKQAYLKQTRTVATKLLSSVKTQLKQLNAPRTLATKDGITAALMQSTPAIKAIANDKTTPIETRIHQAAAVVASKLQEMGPSTPRTPAPKRQRLPGTSSRIPETFRTPDVTKVVAHNIDDLLGIAQTETKLANTIPDEFVASTMHAVHNGSKKLARRLLVGDATAKHVPPLLKNVSAFEALSGLVNARPGHHMSPRTEAAVVGFLKRAPGLYNMLRSATLSSEGTDPELFRQLRNLFVDGVKRSIKGGDVRTENTNQLALQKNGEGMTMLQASAEAIANRRPGDQPISGEPEEVMLACVALNAIHATTDEDSGFKSVLKATDDLKEQANNLYDACLQRLKPTVAEQVNSASTIGSAALDYMYRDVADSAADVQPASPPQGTSLARTPVPAPAPAAASMPPPPARLPPRTPPSAVQSPAPSPTQQPIQPPQRQLPSPQRALPSAADVPEDAQFGAMPAQSLQPRPPASPLSTNNPGQVPRQPSLIKVLADKGHKNWTAEERATYRNELAMIWAQAHAKLRRENSTPEERAEADKMLKLVDTLERRLAVLTASEQGANVSQGSVSRAVNELLSAQGADLDLSAINQTASPLFVRSPSFPSFARSPDSPAREPSPAAVVRDPPVVVPKKIKPVIRSAHAVTPAAPAVLGRPRRVATTASTQPESPRRLLSPARRVEVNSPANPPATPRRNPDRKARHKGSVGKGADEDQEPATAATGYLPPKDIVAMLGTYELPLYDKNETRAESISNSNMFTRRAYYPNKQQHGSLVDKQTVQLGPASDPDTRFNAKRKMRPHLGWSAIDDGPASKMARRF
jgi:hypothetical protein